MKTFAFIAAFLVAGFSAAAAPAIPGKFELETRVYVFRNSDFRSITFPAARNDDDRSHLAIFGSPSVAQFDQETLSLEGDKFSWNGGPNPPGRFTLVPTPTVSLTPGKAVSFLSTIATQYLEKSPDGALLIREIPPDSPDAPQSRLTFRMEEEPRPNDLVRLTCEADISTITNRENVPGVTLDVGKPQLTRFRDTLAMTVQPQVWSAFALRPPNGGDYRMLVLIKLEGKRASDLMTAQEFHTFATYYYQNPKPDLIGRAIESLDANGFLTSISAKYGCIGFFAEVFAANPRRLDEWRRAIDRQEVQTREMFRRARELSQPGAILALKNHSVLDNEIFWGAFFASGNPAYLRKLTDQLKYVVGGFSWRPGFLPAGKAAMWTLASNLADHPLVRTTLEDVRSDADPRTRELIEHLLTKDQEGVRQELAKFGFDASNSRRSYYEGAEYTGPRASGEFDEANPADRERVIGTRR